MEEPQRHSSRFVQFRQGIEDVEGVEGAVGEKVSRVSRARDGECKPSGMSLTGVPGKPFLLLLLRFHGSAKTPKPGTLKKPCLVSNPDLH